jgi:hypothetical protein
MNNVWEHKGTFFQAATRVAFLHAYRYIALIHVYMFSILQKTRLAYEILLILVQKSNESQIPGLTPGKAGYQGSLLSLFIVTPRPTSHPMFSIGKVGVVGIMMEIR